MEDFGLVDFTRLKRKPGVKFSKYLRVNKKVMPNPKYYKKKIRELRKGIK